MMNELDIINWDKKLLTNDFTEKDLSYLATLSTEYQAENNEKKYLQNYDALKDLKKKQAIYNEIIALSSGATVLGTATSNPILAGIGRDRKSVV